MNQKREKFMTFKLEEIDKNNKTTRQPSNFKHEREQVYDL